MAKSKKKIAKKIFISIGSVLLVIVLIALSYLGYVIFSYSRMDDYQALAVSNTADGETIKVGETYTIVTQNLGFGAYTADFTFFMDGGKESWAESEDSVKDCINKGTDTVKSFEPDFVFFQEIDTNSTRSYHIDERELIYPKFQDYSSVFAVNYHSAFLAYPFNQPHGTCNSGIMTLSRSNITSSMRRSLEISTSISKFLDLDRCYSVTRVPVDGGKELVLYNVHLSAYGGSDAIRHSQMTMLFSDMQAEYEKGNYCVCGGDFNHDFTGDSTKILNGGDSVDFGWAQPFPSELLPDCISRAMNYDGETLQPTCRNCDVPYEEGNFTIIVDGFLVSQNVTSLQVTNYQTGFEYSDHCPVIMSFKLN